MKAASAVLVQSQRQFTLIGLPPRLIGLTIGIGFLPGFLGSVIPFAKLLVIPTIIGVGIFFWQQCRRDPHYDRVLLLAPRFWRRGLRRPGPTRTRHLIAGVRHVG